MDYISKKNYFCALNRQTNPLGDRLKKRKFNKTTITHYGY